MKNKPMKRVLLSALCCFVLVFGFGISTQPLFAGDHSVNGNHGWASNGSIYEVGENHVYFAGAVKGVFFNDDSNGLFNGASVVCPFQNDIINGVGTAEGHCIVTDKDGDKAFATWENSGPVTGQSPGWFQFTSGTGKYMGITSGKLDFYAVFATATEGYCVWKG